METLRGEVMALISVFAFALSYLYVNKAQANDETCDNGLLPVLVVTTCALILTSVVGLAVSPASFHLSAGWQRALLFVILSGISWNYLSKMTLLASIAKIGATRGLVVKSIAPMLTVALAVLLFHERLDVGDKVGFLLMLVSIGLLVVERIRFQETDASSPPRNGGSPTYGPWRSSIQPRWRSPDQSRPFRSELAYWRSWLSGVTGGIALGIAAALLQAIGHLLRKVSTASVPSLFGATVDMMAATLAYLLYLAWTGRLKHHVQFYMHSRSSTLLLASLLSAVGVFSSFISIANASISTVAMILGIQPIVVPILSSLLFPGFERFTWFSYAATGLVSLGVVAIMWH